MNSISLIKNKFAIFIVIIIKEFESAFKNTKSILKYFNSSNDNKPS